MKCLFGHKWKYDVEQIKYATDLLDFDIKNIVHTVGPPNNPNESAFNVKVRICSRCYKKQRESLLPSNLWEEILVKRGWSDFDLNKDQNRDKKLNDLGI